MIDPVGGGPRTPWTTASSAAGPSGAAAPRPAPRALPPEPAALSATARATRGLAGAPPVDAGHVAAVRAALAAGAYVVDPGRIADRMIAADWPR